MIHEFSIDDLAHIILVVAWCGMGLVSGIVTGIAILVWIKSKSSGGNDV